MFEFTNGWWPKAEQRGIYKWVLFASSKKFIQKFKKQTEKVPFISSKGWLYTFFEKKNTYFTA